MSATLLWRRLCRILHRDLGYFFFGATIVYAVSGVALNHRDHWNPSYSLVRREVQLDVEKLPQPIDAEAARNILLNAKVDAPYQNHYNPTPGTVRIFFKNGTLTLRPDTGAGEIEMLKRRPFLHLFNKLHYNPGPWWTWFADIFSVALAVVAISGLFLLRGKHGITQRGGLLVAAGILLPAILVAMNI